MALITCNECNQPISDQAAACPHCGVPRAAKPRDGASGRATLVLGLIGLIMAAAALHACLPEPGANGPDMATAVAQAAAPSDAQRKAWLNSLDNPTLPASQRLNNAKSLIRHFSGSPSAEQAAARLSPLEIAAQEEATRGVWHYESSPDAMSGGIIRSASVQSENAFEFDFPYQGLQHASLTLRRHPRFGDDVMLMIDRGQILCSSYDCPVRVRFDDGTPITLTGSRASDNSSDTIFIPGFEQFAKRLGTTRTLRVEVDVYANGALQTEFKVKGFDQARLSQ
jgi:hypothetical protein